MAKYSLKRGTYFLWQSTLSDILAKQYRECVCHLLISISLANFLLINFAFLFSCSFVDCKNVIYGAARFFGELDIISSKKHVITRTPKKSILNFSFQYCTVSGQEWQINKNQFYSIRGINVSFQSVKNDKFSPL